MTIDELLKRDIDPATADFIGAWMRWRGDRLVPRRSDMVLSDIRRHLDIVMLFEVPGPDDVLVRVCGTRIAELLEFPSLQWSYRDHTRPEDWPRRSRTFQCMAGQPCGGYMAFRDSRRTGRVIDIEAVSLPMVADDPSRPPLVFSCNVPQAIHYGEPGPSGPTLSLAHAFTFVDIGAGMPDFDPTGQAGAKAVT